MPDKFSETLRDGSARFGEDVTPSPARLVRARGDQRRRRTVAGSVVLSVAVIAGGIGGLYGFGQLDRAVTPPSPRPVTSVTAPAPTSGPSGKPTSTAATRPTGRPTNAGSAPASQTAPASIASSGYTALAGQWKQTDGAGESLYIFPDGVIGLGEAAGANYPMCAGQVQPAVNGVYPFTAACGIFGGTAATGETITVTDGTLTIHVPGAGGGGGSAVTWVPVAATGLAPSSQTGSAPPPWLVGTWSTRYETFKVASTGAVTWSFTGQQGQTVSGAGTVEPVPGGGSRIITSFGSPRVAGVWPIFHLVDGQLSVIGGEGAQDFTLTGG
jgi:hypothetical protein